MKFFAAFVAAGVVSTLAGTAAGQTAPATELRPIARVSATEVLLDVAVLDKHGKPLKNVKSGDIEIYEDDVRQQITSFRYVPPAETQRQGGGSQAAPTASRPLRAVNLVCLVFHNLDPVARSRAMEVAREFLKHDLPPETFTGLFVLDDRLNPVHPFTNNREELAEAVSKTFTLRPLDFGQASEAVLTANPTAVTVSTIVDNATHSASTTYRVGGGELSSTTIAGAEVSTGTGASNMRGNRVTENRDFSHLTGMRETDKISNMVSQFGKLPGRKLVLLLSTGFRTTGDPELFRSIVSQANENRTTVYAIDVSGLSEVSSAHAGDLALGQVADVSRTQASVGGTLQAAKEKSRQGDTMNDAVRASDAQASLRDLAESTGGFLVANTNEFQKPLQRIADDLEAHYEVTYRPASGHYDGQLRTIKVKPAHADWHTESRAGYFAMPVLENSSALLPYETMGLAVLNSKPLPHGFEIGTAAFHFRSSGESRVSALVVEVPGTALTAAPSGRGTQLLRGQVLALVKNREGQIVDKFSVDAPYEIPADKLPELRKTPFVFSHPLDLPPGRYTAETVVMDRVGGRVSTQVTPFDSAGGNAGLGLSSVLLIRRLEPATPGSEPAGPLLMRDKRVVPFVETTIAADVSPYAYFVVYPNPSNSAKPRLQVEFLVDGASLANQTSDLREADASGAIPMILRAAVHTGHCTLKITVVQGDEKVEGALSYTVAK